MLSGRRGDARELGQNYGLFAGAFLGLLVVLAILGQYGLADPFIAFLVVALALVSFAVIGILSRTLSEADFHLAGRAVPHVFNGLATTAAFVSGTGFIGFAGAFFTAFFTGAFFTGAFFAGDFFTGPFLAAFLTGAFLAGAFFTAFFGAAFLAGAFLPAGLAAGFAAFLAGAFLAGALPAAFLAGAGLAAGFFAGALLEDDAFFTGFLGGASA